MCKRRKKGLTFLLIFISSPLEIVSGEKKTPAFGAIQWQFYSILFTNPDRYIYIYIYNLHGISLARRGGLDPARFLEPPLRFRTGN